MTSFRFFSVRIEILENGLVWIFSPFVLTTLPGSIPLILFDVNRRHVREVSVTHAIQAAAD